MFDMTLEDLGEVVVLHARGSLVRGEETGLLCTAVRHHGRNLVLDLNNVNTIDAAGIGALIALQTAGVYLRLQNPSKPVYEILRVTGLDSVFEIFESNVPLPAIADGGSRQAVQARCA
jgi:anti-anti-sigma factor